MKRSCIVALLALLAPLAVVAQEEGGPRFDEEEYEMGQRVTRQYLERLQEANMNAASIREQWMVIRARAKSGPRPLDATNWEFLGPMNQGGRIKGIAVGRADTNLWYCAGDGGGIWKSTTAGSDWTPLTDTLPSLRMATLAMSPFDDGLVIGATHEGMIYRTSDAGASWAVIAVEGIRFVNDLKFHPTDPQRVVIGAEGGLAQSSDAGASWTVTHRGGRVTSLSFNPRTPSIMFYAHNNGQGKGTIFRTTDGGETWKSVRQWGVSDWGRVNVRVAPSDPDVVYASVSDSSQFFKSFDGGLTWSALPTHPYRSSYQRGFDVFEVAPESPEVVITGGTSVFRTTDGGMTWSEGDTINKDLHVDQHAFLFPPHLFGTFICGNDGGVYRTRDYMADRVQWIRRDTNLATLQIYNCAIHPLVPDTIIVGCQDNGYDKFKGNPQDWRVVGGDGFCTIYDYESPGYFYHEYVYHNLHRADNGFTWWSGKFMDGLPTDTSEHGFYTGFVDPDRSDWFGQAITISPTDPKTLYIGSQKLYKTMNRAERWEPVSAQEYALNRNDFITTIAVAPGTSHRLYVGTNSGTIYRVIDEPGDLRSIDVTPSFGPVGRIRGIVVAPDDPQTAYVCGDGGWQNRGVLATTNGGYSWTVVSNGLPKGGVNRLLLDPDSVGTIYAGTVFGLYYTRDGGISWHPMPDFPNVEVWDFSFYRPERTLLVGTYGRGAIRSREFIPPPSPAPVSPVREPAEAQGPALEVRGDGGGTEIVVRSSRGAIVSIELHDYLGRLVAELHRGYLAAGEHRIATSASSVGGLRSGAYIVTLRTSDAITRRSFVVVQ